MGGCVGPSERIVSEIHEFLTQDWVKSQVDYQFVAQSLLSQRQDDGSIGIDVETGQVVMVFPESSPDLDLRLTRISFNILARNVSVSFV